MKTEDLVLDEGRKGEEIEEVGEVLPHVGIAVFSQTLVVEPVDLGDLAGLVVSSKDGDTLGVTDLKTNKEGDGFDGVVAAIDVVTCIRSVRGGQAELARKPTHEEVVCVGIGTSNAE